MNDYGFGRYIYRLRSEAKLSQAELAARLGVTNKAVSKWEVGSAKPSMETVRKLAALFQVSVEQLLRIREGEKNVDVKKIVITGGPSAGKTTAMSWIQNAFTQKGYAVLFVPETATELITGGVAPWTCGSNADYQKCQMHLQLEKERVFEQAAKTMNADKVLIVCDRGALDNKAYMDSVEFAAVLAHLGTDEITLRDGYDAVFHLVTAAKGAVEFYTTANNAARTETPEQAAALDDLAIIPYEDSESLPGAGGMALTRELIGSLKPGQSLSIFIGPEGGFSDGEVELAMQSGVKPVTLGKRILRTETAGMFVMAAVGLLLE